MAGPRSLPPRRWIVRSAIAALIGVLLLSAVVDAATSSGQVRLGPGTVDEPADERTYVSIQGFHFQGISNKKKPARLVAAGPRGDTRWLHDGGQTGAVWFYDVDPLADGNLLVTSTVPGDTVVYEYDPANRSIVWSRQLDAEDTHDVDLINGDELLVANMRNMNETSGQSDDRVYVYNLTTDEITWEWYARDHYPASTAGGYGEDWTHVNDVDKVGDGRYLVSLRNFDQAVVIDRPSGEIVRRLGSDGNLSRLYEQHNPDYLESENGTPAVLVADSENDRIVEYARENGSWTRTWKLTGRLKWPRDADRLPNGNTLVVDTLHHRVIEVTPTGEIVWEYYAAWAPYDAERGVPGSNGPTIRDLNASGNYVVSGGAGRGPAGRVTFSDWLVATVEGTPLEAQATWFAQRWSHITPFVKPVWLSSWAFASVIAALLLLVGWGVGEGVYQRARIRRAVAAAGNRIRSKV
jgi:hypothetical protein